MNETWPILGPFARPSRHPLSGQSPGFLRLGELERGTKRQADRSARRRTWSWPIRHCECGLHRSHAGHWVQDGDGLFAASREHRARVMGPGGDGRRAADRGTRSGITHDVTLILDFDKTSNYLWTASLLQRVGRCSSHEAGGPLTAGRACAHQHERVTVPEGPLHVPSMIQ